MSQTRHSGPPWKPQSGSSGATSKGLHYVTFQSPLLVLHNSSVTVLSIQQLNLNFSNGSLASTKLGRVHCLVSFVGKVPENEWD